MSPSWQVLIGRVVSSSKGGMPGGMGEEPTVQLEIAKSFGRHFKAVPTWMLTFRAAHNLAFSPMSPSRQVVNRPGCEQLQS